MDVFCYWRNHEADLKAGRIGHFKTTPVKRTELADGYPDFLWAFRSPTGAEGGIQLIARLRWADRRTATPKPPPGHAYIHYDPADAHSVTFEDSGTSAAVEATSRWVANHFPRMVAAKFQGAAGQEAIRGVALNELQRLSSAFATRPFPLSAAARA